MKKIIMVVLMLSLLSLSVYAEDTTLDTSQVETTVTINGDYLYSDAHHMLNGDTVFVVGKYLIEAFGGRIQWNKDEQIMRVLLEGDIIDFTIGSDIVYINEMPYELNKAPYIKDGRTMIPLKFVSDVFECDVKWIQETYTVEITKEGLEIPDRLKTERNYTDEDFYWLAKITTVESGEQSFEMALAIANTVVNRMNDYRFPNTIHDVIFQIDTYVQFPPAHKSSFVDKEAGYLSRIAAKKALEGVNNIGYSLYFNNAPFRSKTDDLIRVIHGEYFYE